MFNKLKQKWGVNGINLVLIISTFAIGGSSCGFLSRQLLLLTGLEKNLWWYVLYVVLMTITWPVCVLVVSIPLGQYRFFSNYLRRMGRHFQGGKKKIRVAVLASGSGSNAQAILGYFQNHASIEIALILTNKPNAGVRNHAQQFGVPSLVFDRTDFQGSGSILPILQKHGIQWIVLAGFLWKIPDALVDAYPGKIINIHPALLPDFGGKGMYGIHVHRAVLEAKRTASGITIHEVDGQYDHGTPLFQTTCAVTSDDTPESLAARVLALEHRFYAPVLEARILGKDMPSANND
jgi:formyltetrahydrofolate-dependent phosphoribosylglycinamide formyltransferase